MICRLLIVDCDLACVDCGLSFVDCDLSIVIRRLVFGCQNLLENLLFYNVFGCWMPELLKTIGLIMFFGCLRPSLLENHSFHKVFGCWMPELLDNH